MEKDPPYRVQKRKIGNARALLTIRKEKLFERKKAMSWGESKTAQAARGAGCSIILRLPDSVGEKKIGIRQKGLQARE